MALINVSEDIKKRKPPIEIIITDITGDIKHSSDFKKATLFEKTTVVVSGTLEIPDQQFALPIRQNDNKLKVFLAEVKDGLFSVKLNFPEDGAFIYSDNECNLDLPYPVFTVKAVRFDVLRLIP